MRFRLSHVLWLFLTLGIATAWYVDRSQLLVRIKTHNPPISQYGEKHQLWSPSAYLRADVLDLEKQLADRIPKFQGPFVSSSQGLSDASLRQPTLDTLDAVIVLLDAKDAQVRLIATQLLALYLESVSGSDNLNSECYATRIQFHVFGHGKALSLLSDNDKQVRGAAALLLGNSIGDNYTMQLMSEAFDKENDQSVKWKLSWAYWKITNNYNRSRR